MNRRELIRGIGAAICAGLTPTFIPSLVGATSGFAIQEAVLEPRKSSILIKNCGDETAIVQRLSGGAGAYPADLHVLPGAIWTLYDNKENWVVKGNTTVQIMEF